jgi:hypothetical protein
MWAWASAAFAQSSVPDLAQSLNAAVFVPKGSAAAAPLVVFPAPNAPLAGAAPAAWLAPIKPQAFAPGYPPIETRQMPGGGAAVTLWSPDGVRQRLEAMGFKDGDKVYGGQSRLYLFAAVHGTAVGLNLQGMQRTGWSTDHSSALVGDGQIGVGWRKGDFEADLGYVHRSVHLINAPLGASDGYGDDMGALSFAFHLH